MGLIKRRIRVQRKKGEKRERERESSRTKFNQPMIRAPDLTYRDTLIH